MLREIEVGDSGIAPEAAHLSFEDILRYGAIIARVVMMFKAVDSMAVGSSMKLDPVKLHIRGGEFEWSGGEVKRTK